jgi:hypothetical protein
MVIVIFVTQVANSVTALLISNAVNADTNIIIIITTKMMMKITTVIIIWQAIIIHGLPIMADVINLHAHNLPI